MARLSSLDIQGRCRTRAPAVYFHLAINLCPLSPKGRQTNGDETRQLLRLALVEVDVRLSGREPKCDPSVWYWCKSFILPGCFYWFCYWITSELRLGWDFFSFFLFISFTDRKLPVMFERVSPFFVVVCPHFITDLSFRWSLMTIGASQLFRITSMTSSQKNKRS